MTGSGWSQTPIVVVFKDEAGGVEVSIACENLAVRERAAAVAYARERFVELFRAAPEVFGLRMVVERWERGQPADARQRSLWGG
jgi:hypothetical protein